MLHQQPISKESRAQAPLVPLLPHRTLRTACALFSADAAPPRPPPRFGRVVRHTANQPVPPTSAAGLSSPAPAQRRTSLADPEGGAAPAAASGSAAALAAAAVGGTARQLPGRFGGMAGSEAAGNGGLGMGVGGSLGGPQSSASLLNRMRARQQQVQQVTADLGREEAAGQQHRRQRLAQAVQGRQEGSPSPMQRHGQDMGGAGQQQDGVSHQQRDGSPRQRQADEEQGPASQPQ